MVTVVEGKTLTSAGEELVRLGIEGERFVEPGGPADLSFEEGYLFPAAIDIHVHFREPGDEHKEDLVTGTTSAAFGGVGLAVDMPNTDPATTTVDAYEAKAQRVDERALVDVGLWAGVGPEGACFDLGDRATGYKLYAGPTTGPLLVAEPEQWDEAVRHAAGTGRPLAVHAEHPALLARAREAERHPDDPASHARSRPGEAEVRVIDRLAPKAATAGTRLHGAHVSDPRSARILERHGHTSEVTPHHVLLDSHDVEEQGAFAKVNPPIRAPSKRKALFRALSQGRIGCVASDHAPHTVEEKEAGFDEAPSGLPGVETLFPLMLAKALEGEIAIDRVVDACCRSPAEVVDVPAGRLEVGALANLVHVPEAPREIRGDDLHSKCGWTPYEGRQGVFPDTLFVRGRPVIEDGELVAEPDQGRFVGGPAWES